MIWLQPAQRWVVGLPHFQAGSEAPWRDGLFSWCLRGSRRMSEDRAPKISWIIIIIIIICLGVKRFKYLLLSDLTWHDWLTLLIFWEWWKNDRPVIHSIQFFHVGGCVTDKTMVLFCLKIRVALHPIKLVVRKNSCTILKWQLWVYQIFRQSHVWIWIWVRSLDTFGYPIQEERNLWSPRACNLDISGFNRHETSTTVSLSWCCWFPSISWLTRCSFRSWAMILSWMEHVAGNIWVAQLNETVLCYFVAFFLNSGIETVLVQKVQIAHGPLWVDTLWTINFNPGLGESRRVGPTNDMKWLWAAMTPDQRSLSTASGHPGPKALPV